MSYAGLYYVKFATKGVQGFDSLHCKDFQLGKACDSLVATGYEIISVTRDVDLARDTKLQERLDAVVEAAVDVVNDATDPRSLRAPVESLLEILG